MSTSLYAQRRARVAAQLGAGGIAVIPTAPERARNRDSDFLYRHDSYFYYLSGFTEPNAWLREHAGVWASGQRVLCVADGEGRNSVWLAQRGLQVDAFDISEVGVAKARRLAELQGARVNFQVADCDGFAWPQAVYDGVAAIFIQFADPALRARLFAHIQRSLKPGGTLVLQGYTPNDALDSGTLGVTHQLTKELTVRAGYTYGKEDDQTLQGVSASLSLDF